MGACASVHHHKASAMKEQVSFDSPMKPDHKVVNRISLSNEKLPVMDGHVAVKPQLPPYQSPATFSEYGSKEETFFDSQAWLDSDYEDEFMSVNGEFTPSRGNTPVHHSLTLGTPKLGSIAQAIATDHNESLGSTREPSPTPTEKKRRLLDLFKESVRENNNDNDSIYEEIITPPTKDAEMDLKKDGLKSRKEKQVGSMHGCFSNLLFVRGSGRRKEKSLIPSLSV